MTSRTKRTPSIRPGVVSEKFPQGGADGDEGRLHLAANDRRRDDGEDDQELDPIPGIRLAAGRLQDALLLTSHESTTLSI